MDISPKEEIKLKSSLGSGLAVTGLSIGLLIDATFEGTEPNLIVVANIVGVIIAALFAGNGAKLLYQAWRAYKKDFT